MMKIPTAAKITTTTIGMIIAMANLELLLLFFDRLHEVPSEQSFGLSPTLLINENISKKRKRCIIEVGYLV